MPSTLAAPNPQAAAGAPPAQAGPRSFLRAPPSASEGLAALLLPAVAVGSYTALAAWQGQALARPDSVLCLMVCMLAASGRAPLVQRPLPSAVAVLGSWLALLCVLGLCGWATGSLGFFHPPLVLAWAAVTPLLHWALLMGLRRALQAHARRPGAQRRAVVVGAGPMAAQVAAALQARPDTPTQVLGFFDDRGGERIAGAARSRCLGGLADVAERVRALGVHEVYLALPLGVPRLAPVLAQLQGTTASLHAVPDLGGVSVIQGRLHEVDGIPLVGLCESPFTGLNGVVKRLGDLVLATAALLFVAPLMLAIAVGVKRSSPGPVIFRQRRNGLDGHEIVVYKFRTMRALDDGTQVAQARRDDPRVTPFGRFLRRSSLDELPQLVNVLQGRMSLVGPRPHAVAHNEMYRALIPAYMLRHKVRPGITGWAQVNGHRGETETLEKMQARVACDLTYLRDWSPGLDLQILLRTLRLVLRGTNAY
ncbi:MAG: undecaprenyl-phosphate glucose phosphotransferase [Rubrivivax sp.]|nr:undecaprenyl-phosphate glucose phosphotransferase [Rubrivivax sp.]